MPTKDVERAHYGKRLLTYSFGVIIFIWGGGYIESAGKFGGQFIVFRNSFYILHLSAVLIFLFYWHRFWTWSREPSNRFTELWILKLDTNTELKQYLNKLSKKEIREKINNGSEVIGSVWEKNDPNRPLGALFHPRKLDNINLFDGTITLSPVNTRNSGIAGEYVMKLDWDAYCFVIKAKLKALMKTIFSGANFSYEIFPHWVAGFAGVSILYRFIDFIFGKTDDKFVARIIDSFHSYLF